MASQMKLNSLYVSTKDFDRARHWYEKILFQREPDMETDRFVSWVLDGVYFGVFNPKITGETISFGNNCVPNIEVNNIEELHERLVSESVEIVMKPHKVNETKIFQCLDSEGNTLEFYHWLET